VDAATASGTLSAQLLLDPAVIDDPYPFYRRLVTDAPVWTVPGTDVVVVSSYDGVTEALNRTADFSSNLLALLYRRDDGTPSTYPFDVGIQALATADPPTHSTHRNAVFPELVASRMAAMRGDIETLARQQLDHALRQSVPDVMHDIANPIPIRVVSKLVGFTDEDPDALLAAAFDTTGMLAATEPLPALLECMERSANVVSWVADQLQHAVAQDDADGLLDIMGAAIRRNELTFDEGLAIVTTLLSAGGESTTSLIGNAIHLLATRPDLQTQVRDDTRLVKPFIEEALRLQSPFRHHLRRVAHDTELLGVPILEGTTMLLLWAAANRDPAEFDRPDDVVLDRPAPRHHLGFGRGIHLCVGAPLARLEAEIVLTQLLDRTSGFALVPDAPPARVNSLMVRRFDSLPLAATTI
jgi:cytochrome P450